VHAFASDPTIGSAGPQPLGKIRTADQGANKIRKPFAARAWNPACNHSNVFAGIL
jgi:hypothetical protein